MSLAYCCGASMRISGAGCTLLFRSVVQNPRGREAAPRHAIREQYPYTVRSAGSKSGDHVETAQTKAATARKRRPGRTSKKKVLSSDEIYERILAAVTEGRLGPGMQLVEERLA